MCCTVRTTVCACWRTGRVRRIGRLYSRSRVRLSPHWRSCRVSSSSASSWRKSSISWYSGSPLETRLARSVGGSGVGSSRRCNSFMAFLQNAVHDVRAERTTVVRRCGDVGSGGHQRVPVQPPLPLGIVLGETFADIAWAGQIGWPAVLVERLILEGDVLAHRTFGSDGLVRPGVGVVLFDHPGGAEQLDRLAQHQCLDLGRGVLLRQDPVDELQLVRPLGYIGMQRHGTEYRAVRLWQVDELEQAVGEEVADLRRTRTHQLQLLVAETTEQFRHHLLGDARRR